MTTYTRIGRPTELSSWSRQVWERVEDGLWVGITVPTEAMHPDATYPAPVANFRSGLYCRSFDDEATNEDRLHFNVVVPQDWMTPGKLYPEVHWAVTTTATGTVRWGIEYSTAQGYNQAAFPASTTIYVNEAGSGTAYQHMTAKFANADAITVSEPGQVILGRFFRNSTSASDTLTGVTAFAFAIRFMYEATSKTGTYNKSPDFYKRTS